MTSPTMDDALMTLEDIAQAHRCSLRHARDVIVRTPGFPAEAPTSTPRNRLWVRAEVRAFITRRPAGRSGAATLARRGQRAPADQFAQAGAA